MLKYLEIVKIMNAQKRSLKNKVQAAKQGVMSKAEPTDGAVSPYFSPRKTRNRVKIEYEKPSIVTEIQKTKQLKNTKVSKDSKDSQDDVVPQKKLKKSQKMKTETTTNESVKSEQSKTESTSTQNAEEKNDKEIKWEPRNWQKTLENLREMRKNTTAPVDTMGCHKCSDEDADEKTQRYHNLIALMLSSQTKDQTTYEAMKRLKAHGLTPENIVKSSPIELEKLIAPVSFYKNKTKYIQKASEILINQYSGDIPNTVDGLQKLPGVGPKMAHICMNTAWNVITGIGVDTHVHRISNRLNWVEKATKEPEKTRIALENWLPKELWHEVNEMLVGFGQTICTPINPKCGSCINADICPSSQIKKKKK